MRKLRGQARGQARSAGGEASRVHRGELVGADEIHGRDQRGQMESAGEIGGQTGSMRGIRWVGRVCGGIGG